MANQQALGEFQVPHEQIYVAPTLQIAKQILVIAQYDVIRQFAKEVLQCGSWNNRIVRRRHYIHLCGLRSFTQSTSMTATTLAVTVGQRNQFCPTKVA